MSWATSAFRWIDTEYLSFGRSSILRWSSGIFTSYLTPVRRWTPQIPRGGSFFLSWNLVDDVVWSFITAFESVALVSMLCFFFLFCGCTV